MLAAAALLLAALTRAAAQPLATRLRVEYRDAPLNIDESAPRFSWAFTHSRRGATQVSAALSVYAGAARAAPLWSATVPGPQTLNVPYAGPPLEPDADYSFCVVVNDGAGGASPPACATFSTALLGGDASWRGAAWVGGAGDGLAADGALRAEFVVPGAAVLRARLHIVGLGAYHAWINGARTDDHELHSFTQFQIKLAYDTHDVTALVRPGCNALAVRLTKGWCAQTRADVAVRNIGACNRTALRALLSVTTDAGTRFYGTGGADLVATSAPSPIVASDIYAGETFDARLLQNGWDACDFTPVTPWRAAVVLAGPPLVALAPGIATALVASQHVTRVDTEYTAVNITQPAPGIFVFAFAQTMSGLTRLRLAGAAPGTVIVMRHAELLFPSGLIHNHYAADINMTGIYIARGGVTEEYTSEAVSYGFQYVQVEGLGNVVPDTRTLTALFTHGDVPHTGAFETSSVLINAAMNATRMSSLSNIADTPTDCPQRERRGWLGDASVSAEMLLYSWDVAPFYTKFLSDICDAVAYLSSRMPAGYIKNQVPCVAPFYPHGGDVCDPNWSVALPRIAVHMLTYYNDTRLAAHVYPTARGYAEDAIAQANATGGLLRASGLGDWCALWQGDACKFTGPDLAAFPYVQTLDATAALAAAAGAAADAARYAALAARARALYAAAFFHSANATFGEGFPINQLMPLSLGGVVSAAREADVYAALKAMLAHGRFANTTLAGGGILTSQLLYPALSARGDTAAAVDLLLSTAWPSFGAWLAGGATTLYETWGDTQPEGCDGGGGPSAVGCSSRNHIMFGGWAAWAYAELGGLRRSGSSWAQLNLGPALVPQLTSAAASVDSPMGLVAAAYSVGAGGRYALNVSVPWGARASVAVAAPPGAVISEGGAVVWDGRAFVPGAQGVDGAAASAGGVSFDVGGGSYGFAVAPQPAAAARAS